MDIGGSPNITTTKRNVKYTKSSWSVHEFEVWSGEFICRVVSLKMRDSLLVWVGGREPRLDDLALAVPHGRSAVATSLVDAGGAADGLAARLAAALSRPVHVCCGLVLDRFTAPLVEKGIATEIKNHPEYF
ncbi:uncharacterized protein LOC116765831 [Danaus plexippus]|nr:uncharacterized protein LOC116765831 [Danaus plexippus]